MAKTPPISEREAAYRDLQEKVAQLRAARLYQPNITIGTSQKLIAALDALDHYLSFPQPKDPAPT